MSLTIVEQWAIIPALFVTLAALLALRNNTQRAQRRLLLLLSGLGAVLVGVLLLTVAQPGSPSNYYLVVILTPSILGIVALILLYLTSLTNAASGVRHYITMGLLALFAGLLITATFQPYLSLGWFVLPGAAFILIAWFIGRRRGSWPTIVGLLFLALLPLLELNLHNPPAARITPPSNMILQSLLSVVLMGAPALLAALSAALITRALTRETPQPGGPSDLRLLRNLALPILILGVLAYLLYGWSVWDNTVDLGYGGIAMSFIGPTAVAAGMVAAVDIFRRAARRRYVLGGLLFMILAPLLLYNVNQVGMSRSQHQITEDRAARIAAALDDYRAHEGRYPQSLRELTPGDLLIVPRPIQLRGETWCYRGEEDAYQLAAFYREFFSSPVSLQRYASSGEPPWSDLPCSERVAQIEERYNSPMNDPRAAEPPVPTPLPTVEIPGGKTVVQPLLDGAAASPGSWSPDGAYFVFGLQNDALTLHFLDASSGDVCPAEGEVAFAPTLRRRHTWLPDGRLLYLDAGGELLAFTPCQPQPERLTGRFQTTFSLMPAVAPDGNRALLQSEDAYWILDTATLAAQPIRDVQPIAYDLHWDTFAWLPAGDGAASTRLVIAQLNGRGGENGSTLYLVDAPSVDVLAAQHLDHGHNQSPGFIEGLPGERILYNSSSQWLMIDFAATPPTVADILSDIFELDVAFPDDVSVSGSFIQDHGQTFYLTVRLNHPRNKATYLYNAASDEIHVYDHASHTLLLFPDGELVEMTNQDLVPQMIDDYALVRVAAPDAAPQRLAFDGHTPREYPHLNLKYLSQTDQIAVASAHGVSLVSLANGERETFYDLPGPGFGPWLIPSPDGATVIATKEQGALYGPLP